MRRLPPCRTEPRNFRRLDAGESELRRLSQSPGKNRERVHYLSHLSRDARYRVRIPRAGQHVEEDAAHYDTLAIFGLCLLLSTYGIAME